MKEYVQQQKFQFKFGVMKNNNIFNMQKEGWYYDTKDNHSKLLPIN